MLCTRKINSFHEEKYYQISRDILQRKKNIKFHFTEWFEQSEALNRVLQTLAIIYLLSIQNFHFDSGVAPKRISGWSGVDAFTICHTEELIHIILMKSSLRYSKIKVRPSVALSQGVSV